MTEPRSKSLVLKLGGELLESPQQRAQLARFAARIVESGRPLVVVHGGGRAIDVELDRRGLTPRKVDGLRVTDGPTLDAVVAVLAGSSNTELVAALVGHRVAAVGLTGVDAGFGHATRARAHLTASGSTADLGFVGDPDAPDPALLELLLNNGYVPVVASLGIESLAPGSSARPPGILNVNADVMACRIASSLANSELVIAGGTAGVLDAEGRTIAGLDLAAIATVIQDGTATAGMVAKLTACRAALTSGVTTARVVDGRGFESAHAVDELRGTTLVPVTDPAAVETR